MPERPPLFDKFTNSLTLANELTLIWETKKKKAFEMTFSIQERKFEGIAPPAGQFNDYQNSIWESQIND